MANEKLIIVNRRPGMIRGGRSHPPVAEYKPGAFTAAQLADIVGEPEMTVVIGRVVTAEEAAAAAKAEAEALAEAQAEKSTKK